MARQGPLHHELPRYYLRGFCEPQTSFVWRFERSTAYKPGSKHGNNPRRLGLGIAGLHPRGYLVPAAVGRPLSDFEIALQKMEHKADNVIKEARAFKPLSPTDKDVLARYVALMWRRVSPQEAELREVVDRHFDLRALEAGAVAFARDGKFYDARRLFEELAWYRSELGKRQLLLETIVSAYDNFHAGLMRLKWKFYRVIAPHQCVTWDVPVVYDRQLGIRRSPLYFALSSHAFIEATWDGDEDFVWHDATSKLVEDFNRAAIGAADQYVYAASPDERIHQAVRSKTLARGGDA